MANSIRERKLACRKHVKARLNDMNEEEIASQSAAITRAVLESPEYREARSLSIFLSMPGKEISTNEIVVHAMANGKKVFVPYIHPEECQPKSKVMEMLRLLDREDLQSLKPDNWGIPSIQSESINERENALGGSGIFQMSSSNIEAASMLDLMFMPAMAFDNKNRRLGHGKGFYDRYLTKYKNIASTRGVEPLVPYLVGLALREQIIPTEEQLPTTNNDWDVDLVISMKDK